MPDILKSNWATIFGLIGPLGYLSVYALWFPILVVVLFNIPGLLTTLRSDGLISLRRYLPYFALPLFGGLSAAWALVPSDAFSTAMKFSGYICLAILAGMVIRGATEDEKRKIYLSTAIGLIAVFPVALLDIGLSGGISSLYKSYEFNPNMYSRGTAITACLLIPLAIGLLRYANKWFAIASIVLCVGVVFGLYMEAAKLAVIIAAIVFFLVKWQQKLFWPIVTIPLLVAFVFPVFFALPLTEAQQCRLHYMMDSAHHRVMIYQFGTEKILKKPILGWGLDSSRSVPGGAQKIESIKCVRPDGQPTVLSIGGKMPLHPHNAAIQIWLELGLVGSMLLVGTIALFLKRMKRAVQSSEGQAALAASFCSACLIYNISFGLWQSWLMFAMILIGGITLSLGASSALSQRDEV